jgi:hypothetical protein
MHFLGRPKETDFKLLEEQRKLQCQLEVEKLGGGTSPFFSQLCRADKKKQNTFLLQRPEEGTSPKARA